MHTIGVISSKAEISKKIDSVMTWSVQKLTRFIHEHEKTCNRTPHSACDVYQAALEELRFCQPNDADVAQSVEASSIPCTLNPAAWDVDAADARQLEFAISQCTHECPIFAACKASATDPRAMVWAGIAYDDEGRQITLRRIPGTLAIRDINEHRPAHPSSTAVAS